VESAENQTVISGYI